MSAQMYEFHDIKTNTIQKDIRVLYYAHGCLYVATRYRRCLLAGLPIDYVFTSKKFVATVTKIVINGGYRAFSLF